MTTKILWNGSKYAGEEPDPLDTLMKLLQREPLDPIFERYGDFATPLRNHPTYVEHYGVSANGVLFYGNFANYSHGFSVVTDDPEIIDQLLGAIRENKRTDAYAAARRVTKEEDARRAAREQAFLQRGRRQ